MADNEDNKNKQVYYPTPVITNGWYACVEEDNPNLGLAFRKQNRQCIALSHVFNCLPVKAISDEQYAVYQNIKAHCNDAEEKCKKAIDDYCRSIVNTGRSKLDEAEKALELALEDRERILNNLKKKDYNDAPIAVFESSAGLVGFPLEMAEAAKLFALTRQGKVICFDFTDDGSHMNIRIIQPQSLKTSPRSLPKLVI